jgi:hypothetical protein
MARRSEISTATRYEMQGPEFEFRGMRCYTPVLTGPETHLASYTMDTGSFPGVKRPRPGVNHPPQPATKLKKEYSYNSISVVKPT